MNDSDPYDVTQDQQGNPISPDDAAPAQSLKRIGRYRIEKVLGIGGFGLVYLAYDEQLDRLVAIKVPHAKLISKPEDAEAYLTEARTVANLDHPGIVPVHDVGSTQDCPCYVVSKYIEGTDLSTKLKQQRLKYRDAAELVATVAEALHYAHKQGLVHRDVKPGNILIGKDGQPFVVDFGLALREENVGKGPKYAGTPAYMSPEQARGEGHRVDGRSDIFSLGVVFYELLVGRRPFRGDTQPELLEQITSYDPKPPRQIHDRIPKELERICHKAMAKRASERYSTAIDIAEDLHLFLKEHALIQSGTSPGGAAPVVEETVGTRGMSTAADSSSVTDGDSSDSQPIKIVPKGLRSFDAHDADFFLELLPGARDRDGLPDSLRFWKTRIEETDSDNTFSVGLIYGPSGCGKSSLVKAGLLPRLSEEVIPVYNEATPEETESRLLHGLRKRCPALGDNLSLKETLAALRRGQGIPVGKKVLIVLDQFEQWLHAKKDEENTDLVQALRQCDGGRVQCIVMVRDDFWMAVTRFLNELEVELRQGQNFAPVDLFPIRHAEKVLASFGRALRTLPDNIGETTTEQKEFLKQSVAGLADEGKVICVRLALFAEMMKGRAWTPATLKEVGGTSGVGVTFLEEMFSSSSASPKHRLHQKAARAVLRDLLPDSGTEIKGYMRSHAELLEASGYGNRPKDFDDLIRILDSEIRLITPTDPEGKDADNDSVTQTETGQKYFQLTHDYLVHSLRDWLTRKQKETRKGRAELKLYDTSVTWNAKPENRFLPSWWEHLNIRLLTDKKNWTEPQGRMMGKAGRVHGIRSVLVLVALVSVVLGGVTMRGSIEKNRQKLVAQKQEEQNDAEATRLVEGLLQADTSQVKTIIGNLSDYREYAKDDLGKAFAESPDDSNAKVHAALAMLPDDNSVLPFLKKRLLTVSPAQFQSVRDLLADHKADLIANYWQISKDNSQTPARRFQAACALATYDPDNKHWQDELFVEFIAGHLVSVLPTELLPWRNALRPIKAQLTAPLAAIYRDANKGEQVRGFATDTLADYLSDDSKGLFDLLAAANEKQFAPMLGKLTNHRKKAITLGNSEVANSIPKDASEDDKEALAMRQANAAVMLLRMDAAENVWPLLKHSPDPRVRSYIIHWLNPRGGDPQAIIAHYEQETDVTIKRALLLCLGEFELAESQQQPLVETLLDVYRSDSDAGLHAAAEWLLRRWGVVLPDLPVGTPVLSEEERQKASELISDINATRQEITRDEAGLAVRQAAWERQIAEQPAALLELRKGLLTHYPLDENKGSQTANAVEDQPLGEYVGPTLPLWMPGVIGNAVKLNGSGGHFTCGQGFSPERTDSFSYGCWIFIEDHQRVSVLLDKMDDDNNDRGFDMRLEGSFLCARLIHQKIPESAKDNQIKLVSRSTITSGAWHHVMVTYDGSSSAAGMSLFVDGQVSTASRPIDHLSATIRNEVPLQIGMKDRSYSFRGRIDDVRLYDRQLSGREVHDLYFLGLREVAKRPTAERTAEQETLLKTAYRLHDEPSHQLQAQLEARQAALRQVLDRNWYVTSQGQTFVILNANEFQMGSPNSEAGRLPNERWHRRKIGRQIAVATKELTKGQWRVFSDAHKVLPADAYPNASIIPTDDCPMGAVTWYEAAQYCNWLSEQEGIPEDQWCYAPNEEEKYGPGMTVKEGFWKLTGYRLPTDAEWEFACRAGTITSRYYGIADSVLNHYAWFQANGAARTHPVGSLKPNDFGIFDMLGNSAEWINDPYGRHPSSEEGSATLGDTQSTVTFSPFFGTVKEGDYRMRRGGSYNSHPSELRCADSSLGQVLGRGSGYGIRLVRTYPVSPE
ncbi:protein kinase domain-containing protein [Planctomycetaceae bacterium SH139]